MPDDILLTDLRDNVLILTLNRPSKLNALSPDLLKRLAEELEAADADDSVKVVVFYGGEKVFAAGADITAMAQLNPTGVLQSGTRGYWKRIWDFGKPMIAAVRGIAFGGGCELAMSCDLIVASESSQFAQPEIKLGIMPGAGGTQRLAAAIGPYRTMEMVLTGEPISAQEAHDAGLVNRLVPDEKVLEEALALAATIAQRPQVAVRLARQAVRYGVERTLLDGLKMERRNYRMLYDTEDQKEGMAAFLEKRDPQFKDR
ncbi:MAG: enoyl-CoA hydratase-related protein [Chlorobiales bacterium]|nr:enoyl-CoA hydratase-related protein [Chlorobiales bacterium]